jgi:hypothetical protein
MSQYLGLVAKVTKVLAGRAVKLDLDKGEWVWANEWLTKKEG